MARVIGMDVHRDFAQVVVLDAERLRHLGRVQLDKNSLVSFANRLAPDDEVVLEATGNTFAIVRVLRPKVGRIAVANPLQVRLIAHAKIKTDKIDATVLAQLYASGFLPEIWIPDEETEALRRQFTRRSQLVRHRTRLKNEVHAILNANLIGRCPVTDQFTATGRKWLADPALPLAEREAIDRGFREITRVGEDLASLDCALAEQAVDDLRLKRLMTITGIDMVSGLGLIATIGDHTRFASSEKLVSYTSAQIF
jgi:transposase